MLRLAMLASAPNDCSWSLFVKGLFRTLLEPYKRQLDHVVDSRPWTTAGVCCWWRNVRVRRQRRSDLQQSDFGSKIVSKLALHKTYENLGLAEAFGTELDGHEFCLRVTSDCFGVMRQG